VNPVLQENAF
jgi:hypothetical protein